MTKLPGRARERLLAVCLSPHQLCSSSQWHHCPTFAAVSRGHRCIQVPAIQENYTATAVAMTHVLTSTSTAR